MNFDLSDEQALLRDSIDRLFEDHGRSTPRDPMAQWQDYRDLGLLALPFPAASGGLDGGHEAVMLVMEAYGRTLGEAPWLQSVLLAGRLLADAGHPALAEVLDHGRRAALCLYEPGERYRWDACATHAERTDDGWRLRGEKSALLDGSTADLLICPATTADGLGLFLIPADTQGVAQQAHPTPDGRSATNIRFDNVLLPENAAIGDPATNRDLLAAVIDGAIVACCSEAVGAMERLLALTTDYLRTRSQFGVAIGTFQALQHRAADMLVAIEQARSITIYAISMLDAPAAKRTVAAAAARALVNRTGRFVGSEAIQLHGGMGLTSEYPAGRYFQRLTVLETLFGDTEHMLAEVERGGGVGA
ncbi:acyl-CoA dehydrogenase family protein [Hephaestia sp. GCM10023244]|uniref:acyl-CoA dehydrogenase family protein n=1 Tax=unclassified Hephaestia TaxID=2631281 RepID=UPI0020779131|nr:acyl-CoA dehydrogenase [Hephaestia sp. MAHUQ-44]MCM8732299.1 acyl-CoA dehydrogenase [Hephaestia sp. MAHUQ-44]